MTKVAASKDKVDDFLHYFELLIIQSPEIDRVQLNV